MSVGDTRLPVLWHGRAIGGHFCENCGTDLNALGRAPPVQLAWEVRAVADRRYFERVQADGVEFPVDANDRWFGVDTDRATIGRRSPSRGIRPDVDLSAPPADIGVSHQHAVLVRQEGGSWAVIDTGSMNGVYLNECPDAIPCDEAVPVAPGDEIHVGAWTTLTLHCRPSAPKGTTE